MIATNLWGRTIVLAAVCCVSVALTGETARAQTPPAAAAAKSAPTLDQALSEMAVEVEDYLKNQTPSIDSLVMGAFTPPPGRSANAKMVQLLKEKLQARVKLVPAGSWGITGKYVMGQDAATKMFVIKIQATLTDENGDNGQELVKRIITATDEVATLAQTNAELPLTPPAGGAANLNVARSEALAQSIKAPDVVIAQNIVKPTLQSLFGVKLLLVGQDGKIEELVPVERNGLPFVDIRLGQKYFIQLINNADFEAGATVAIDGVNSLEFSLNPAYKTVGKWVVPPRGVGLVKGWLIDNTRGEDFTIMEYAKSAAALVGAAENNVGVITVTFCAAFTDKPPADEPVSLAQKGKGKPEFGTGRGPAFQQQIQDLPRQFGAARTTISIRYLNPVISGDLPTAEAPPQT